MKFRKNDQVTVEIDGLLHDGTGVGHIDGIAIFVPGTAPGDLAEVLVIKVEKRFLRGKLISVLTPSPDRIKPECTLAGKCGGCAFSHLSYDAELREKEQRVRDSFSRIGGMEVSLSPIVASPETFRYRNKAQFPVSGTPGNLTAGFYAPRSHRVVPCDDCLLQPVRTKDVLKAVLHYANEEKLSAYDELSGKGLLRHIFIREGADGGLCVMSVINGNALPHVEKLITSLNELCLGAPLSLMLNINRTRGNVILGKECVSLYGPPYLEDTLCGLRFRISPLSFYQINHAQCESLYRKAAEYADLSGDEVLCDLYCGVGTIGLTMAKKARRLIGVEVVAAAVEDAKENARQNGIENAEFLCGTAETLAAKLALRGEHPDVCIIDPPRSGCDSSLMDALSALSPKRIVYISCDPATLARDVALLTERGFLLKAATPFDMFPRAAHVETVVLMSRVEK